MGILIDWDWQPFVVARGGETGFEATAIGRQGTGDQNISII